MLITRVWIAGNDEALEGCKPKHVGMNELTDHNVVGCDLILIKLKDYFGSIAISKSLCLS